MSDFVRLINKLSGNLDRKWRLVTIFKNGASPQVQTSTNKISRLMTTKTALLGISILLFCISNGTAQNDTVQIKREFVAYTLFYNVVPDQFDFPLIGFVNIAKGNHKGLQLGFVNTTIKGSKGLQIGFVNTTLGAFSGVKLGFVNTTLQNTSGLQLGFVNTTLQNASGLQLGFVNTTLQKTNGLQLGFVNIARKGINGSQVGFVNVADTISNGVPVGFLSIVKKGGYRAIETSVNELYPFNMAFKIGVPRFYSFVQGSYNYNYSNPFALGLGFGSLISLRNKIYFNPEIGGLSPVSSSNTSTTTLAMYVRYSVNSKWQLAAGPSVVWLHYPQGENMYNPHFFSLLNHEINARNRILAGVRIALSFNFTDLS